MDRNWNRGSANGSNNGYTAREKNYRQPHTGGGGQHHYRKKNEFSGPEYYSKVAKPVSQTVKKESLDIALIEDELLDVNFSWIKNGGTQVQSK
jgi:hypothetical protein